MVEQKVVKNRRRDADRIVGRVEAVAATFLLLWYALIFYSCTLL